MVDYAPRVPTDTKQIRELLAKALPNAKCELDHTNAWELLIATILSAQSTDRMINSVTPTLFQRWPTPADLGAAEQDAVEQVVKSTGFYRNKARNIRNTSQVIAAEYGGDVPQKLEALLELPGVARKTAHLVLGVAYGLPTGFVVDTHARRVSQRLGLTTETNPDKIAKDLASQFHKRSWIDTSHRLILHGRYVCLARVPRCERCPLNTVCAAREAEPSEDLGARCRWEQALVESRGEVDV